MTTEHKSGECRSPDVDAGRERCSHQPLCRKDSARTIPKAFFDPKAGQIFTVKRVEGVNGCCPR